MKYDTTSKNIRHYREITHNALQLKTTNKCKRLQSPQEKEDKYLIIRTIYMTLTTKEKRVVMIPIVHWRDISIAFICSKIVTVKIFRLVSAIPKLSKTKYFVYFLFCCPKIYMNEMSYLFLAVPNLSRTRVSCFLFKKMFFNIKSTITDRFVFACVYKHSDRAQITSSGIICSNICGSSWSSLIAIYLTLWLKTDFV